MKIKANDFTFNQRRNGKDRKADKIGKNQKKQRKKFKRQRKKVKSKEIS